MGYFLGMVIGATLGMLLFGYAAAWLIRKITGIANIPSYAIGVSLMTLVGAWSITYDGSSSFLVNWFWYVIGAAIALPLMIARERRNQRPRLENEAS